MIKELCQHKWIQFISATETNQSIMKCTKCGAYRSASEVVQIETLGYIRGFQKYLSILALMISLISVAIAVFK